MRLFFLVLGRMSFCHNLLKGGKNSGHVLALQLISLEVIHL
jgi:hypothetical protein